MDLEQRFTQLRLTAACVQLTREQISELVAITGTLIEERRRIRLIVDRLPDSFGDVRDGLNELTRIVRNSPP